MRRRLEETFDLTMAVLGPWSRAGDMREEESTASEYWNFESAVRDEYTDARVVY
jgi:hypothetical protein